MWTGGLKLPGQSAFSFKDLNSKLNQSFKNIKNIFANKYDKFKDYLARKFGKGSASVELDGTYSEFDGGNQYQNGNIVKGNNNWKINHKGNIDNYLKKKGWTLEQIQETLNDGQNMGEYGKVLKEGLTQGNPTFRIHNIVLNKSLIIDIKANEIIQLGMPGYIW